VRRYSDKKQDVQEIRRLGEQLLENSAAGSEGFLVKGPKGQRVAAPLSHATDFFAGIPDDEVCPCRPQRGEGWLKLTRSAPSPFTIPHHGPITRDGRCATFSTTFHTDMPSRLSTWSVSVPALQADQVGFPCLRNWIRSGTVPKRSGGRGIRRGNSPVVWPTWDR
jgi:hypothetical protein